MIYFFSGFVLGEVFARVNQYMAVIICFAAAAAIYLSVYKNGQSRLWLAVPVFFYCGIFIFAIRGGDSEFNQKWNEKGWNEEYAVSCGIIEKIDEFDDSCRLTLKNVSVCVDNDWYDSRKLFVYTDKDKVLSYGNKVIVRGNIKELDTASNPGQFDYRKYYRALNIEYSMDADYCSVTDNKCNRLQFWLSGLKDEFLCRLGNITEKEDYEVLSAMLLGDKSNLDDGLYSLYRLSGIAHILTISGLHISMLGTGIYKILRRLVGGFIISSVIASVIVCMYGLMTGMGTSALRAVIMFIVMLAADSLGKSYDMASAVSLSGILILTEYPLMLYQFAFQMSVCCILGIGITAPAVIRFLKLKSTAGKTIVTGAVIQFSSMPLLIYHMYTYPALSTIINLIAVPLTGVVMLSGYLGILFSYVNSASAYFLVGAAHYILMIYKALCELVAGFDKLLFMPGQPALWKVGIYYFVYAVFASYMAYKIKADKKAECERYCSRIVQKNNWVSTIIRYLSLAALCTVCVFVLSRKNDGRLTITFMDVGQGDCICIETADGETMLIDGGSSSISDAGGKRIIPMLNFYGIDRLDYVLLSHCDADHINGITELIENNRVKNIVLPDLPESIGGFSEIIGAAEEYGVLINYINAGQKMTVAEVALTCLNPSKADNIEDENSSSMVLLLEYEEFKVLFTGDLDMAGEARVVQTADNYGISLDCSILKVGHHGSKYSSGETFLSRVSPEAAVISCSDKNNYGHPSEEVLERLKAVNSEVFITKDSGAVIVKTDGKDCSVSEYIKK